MAAFYYYKYIFLICFCISLFSCSETDDREFYVSETGSDENPGTIQKPFVTINRAKIAIRKARKYNPSGDYTIYIRKGNYYLDNPVRFELIDSAKNDGKTIVTSYPGERPVISGGTQIKSWRKPSVYPAGLPLKSRGAIWEADIPEGIELFYTMYKGTRLLKRASSPGTTPEHEWGKGFELKNGDPDPLQYMKFPKGLIKNCNNLNDIEIVIVASVPWTMNILAIDSIDEENSICKTKVKGSYPLRKTWPGRPIEPSLWIENSIHYLDEPGEWVVNSKTRKIYYWPKEEKPENIIIPRLKNLITVQGITNKQGLKDIPTKGICFNGLTFTHADRDVWKTDDIGIQHDWEMEDKDNALLIFEAAENCEVTNCHFFNSGGNAIRLDYHCQNIRIENNEISNLGQGGIILIGYGPGIKDVNKNNIIVNNHIHHIGKLYWHSHAIILWQSGNNLVANNFIHDVPRKAICLSGVRLNYFTTEFENRKHERPREYWKTLRWHEIGKRTNDWDSILPYLHTRNNIVENNEIFNALNMLGDGSSINVSGAGTGNIIRNNLLYDFFNDHVSAMMRTDDWQKGTVFENNILFNSTIGGITLKGENDIINNYFINVGGKKGDPLHVLGNWGPFGKSKITHNVFISTGPNENIWYNFKEDKINELDSCIINNNIYFHVSSNLRDNYFLSALRKHNHDKNSEYENPQFIDWENGNFTFKDNSPAKQLDINKISIENIGLTKEFAEHYKPLFHFNKLYNPEIAFSRKSIEELMRAVCDHQLNNPTPHPRQKHPNNWVPSTFYPGVMAIFRVTGDKKYINSAVSWGEYCSWEAGPRYRHADDLACIQTYAELNEILQDKDMIRASIHRLDSIIKETPQLAGHEDWSWSDALFMAPPAFARIGKITGEKRYFEFLNQQFFDASDYYFDKEEHLHLRAKQWYNDSTKIFWSRGVGWSFASIPRILDYLPEDSDYRERYYELARKMAASLKRKQGNDGYWRSNLLDQNEYPKPETSGTAFFCYGMAAGINRGYLDKEEYLPTVLKAWRALVKAIHYNGMLGYVQVPAATPGEVSYNDTQAYGVGAFLLAGEELIKLMNE